MSKRAMKNISLIGLAMTGKEEYLNECLERYRKANNMTDAIAAVRAVIDIDCQQRTDMLNEFYEKWKEEFLVVNKWITLQAMSNIEGNTDAVKALFEHPAYRIDNPNNNYALFRGFAMSPVNFHAADGSGYSLYSTKLIELDKLNPQVAARISTVLTEWKKYNPERQELMKKEIQKIVDTPGLSTNTKEIMTKSLST